MPDYRTPGGIVLDNGGEFTNTEFQQFCHKHRVTLFYTTPYQGIGITEKLHRTPKIGTLGSVRDTPFAGLNYSSPVRP